MAANWAQQQMHQQLPPGWEAKWDPTQGRYFYIDHSTHKTSWVDPRTTQSVAHPLQQQQHDVRHSQAATTHENIPLRQLNSNTTPAKPAWQKQETSLTTEKDKLERLKRMFPTAQAWKISNILNSVENNMAKAIAELEKSGYQQQDMTSQKKEMAIVNKLNTEFPSAEVGVVRDIVQCFDNNEARARTELKGLGYASVRETAARAHSPAKKTSSHTGHAPSPAKSSTNTRTETPRQLSEHEKAKLKSTLVAEFPDYTEPMIVIALDSCNYKLENARRLIQSMQKSKKNSQQKSKESSPAKTSTRSASPAKASTSSSRVASPSTNTTFAAFDTHFTPPSSSTQPRKGTKPYTTPVSSRLTKTATPKPAKSSAASKKSTTRTKTTQNIASQYVSANKTHAVGPDRGLATGPDKDLLIDDYQPYSGPNTELRHGPDANNRQGPSHASGPDPTLRHGASMQVRCGANLDLCGGSSLGQQALPLVTAI